MGLPYGKKRLLEYTEASSLPELNHSAREQGTGMKPLLTAVLWRGLGC